MVNMGQYDYIIGMLSASSIMQFVSKADLTTVATYRASATLSTASNNVASMLRGYWDNEWGKVAYMARLATSATTTSSFQSYYVLLDDCVTRDPVTFICTECPVAKYFNESQTVWNTCWATSRFPARKGIDTAIKAMGQCSDGCLNCLMDINICTICDITNGFLFYRKS